MKHFARRLLTLGAATLSTWSWAADPAATTPPGTGSSAASTNATLAPAPVAATTAAATTTEYDPDELFRPINIMLRGGRSFDRGEKLFKSQLCVMCHRFGEGGGGIGPDISGVGGRMDTREILESIIQPSKTISDIYSPKVYTLTDGRVITGKPMGELSEELSVSQAWTVDPKTMTSSWGGDVVKIKVSEIDTIEESKVSPMMTGLVMSLKEDEIADLVAYLISGGDPQNKMFKPLTNSTAATPAPAPATPSR